MIATSADDFASGIRRLSITSRIFASWKLALLFFVTDRGKSIVLIGFMGVGKSSIGCCLAERTGLPRFDTDEMIAKDFGMPIAGIFAKHGEGAFRDAETEALRSLRRKSKSVVVTGGGIVLRPENIELLKELGLIVHLDADEETVFRRLMRKRTRPLIQTANPRLTVKRLLAERAALYHAAADMAVFTSDLSEQEVATKILQKMEVWRR